MSMKKMSVKLMVVVFCAVLWPGLVLGVASDPSTQPPDQTLQTPASTSQTSAQALPPPPAGSKTPGSPGQQPLPPPGPPGPPESPEFAKIDALGMKGMDMTFPPAAQTLIGDAGGIRSELADYGIGFLGYSINTGMYNFLNDKTPGAVYNGKQPTYFMGSQGLMLTFDAGKIGLNNGQFQCILNANTNGLEAVNPQDYTSIQQLAYFQSFNNDMFELTAGYLVLSYYFMNVNVSGNFAEGALGPAASLIGEERAAFPGVNTPGFIFKYNGPDYFFNKVGFVRSLENVPPNELFKEQQFGLRVYYPGANGLVIDEFGIDRPAGPGQRRLWVRLGGLYNSTEFTNYETLRESRNYGFYGMVDYQIWHPDPTPRGLYAGATFNYAPADTNAFTQYYEGRLWGIGLIPGRPFDMASLVVTYSVVSKDWREFVGSPPPPPAGGPGLLPSPVLPSQYEAPYTDGAVLAYAAPIFPGVILQPGLGIRENPLEHPRVPMTFDGYLCVAVMF